MLKNRIFHYENRIVGLDLLRFIAIFYVFWGHGEILVPNELTWLYNIPIILPFEGVSVFFVLSGFLIGTILNKTIFNTDFKSDDLVRFWLRRWFRTIPLYLIVLILLIILSNDLWNNNFLYFIFCQNLFFNHPDFFGVAWSLSVEEWFYFLFPGLLFLLIKILKNKMDSLFIITILFILLPLALRMFFFNNIDVEISKKIVLLRLDSMMYGVFASIIYFHKNELWRKFEKYSILISSLILILLFTKNYYLSSNNIKIFTFNLESLSVMFLLPYLSSVKKFRFQTINKLIVYVSKISFSLYLIHGSLILWLLIRNLENSDFILNFRFEIQRIILYGLYVFLSFGLATLMYLYIEVPILKYRDRITNHKKN
jgi:peptidoglycan/LPS O-acetylase OafA/YrhL